MNKFLNRRKQDAGLALGDDSHSAATPSFSRPMSPGLGLKKSGTSRWKKNRRQPEPMPRLLTLPTALPTDDEFRTSLIMPNLSARFSMLREQDDPNSKLGKASDDSVLQPRRRSRMTDFGFGSHGGLGDIAEVSSIRSSVRPPFADGRQLSFASEDGYDSDPNAAGSVMARSRPGEGNVLFGGRQKVYMIPKTGQNSSRSLGKPVYEDDIGMSAFQKHKQREREELARQMADEAHQFDFGLDQNDSHAYDDPHAPIADESTQNLPHSPSLSSYDKKRSTNSSSARSEARSSTAATSVASQPLANSAPAPVTGTVQPKAPLERSKSRRLYEPGLDQHIYEQQSSAMTRLNSIHRQRTLTGGKAASPYIHQTKSAGNLHEQGPHKSVYALRAQSPPPERQLAPLTIFGSLMNASSNGGSPITSGPTSPLTPHLNDADEVGMLSQAIEPADRGKATAMGAFNKPKQAFDEKQYVERQMQLQRSTSSASVMRRVDSGTPPALPQRFDLPDRDRSDSVASDRSASNSVSRGVEPHRAFQVFQNAVARNQSRGAAPAQDSPSAQSPDAYPDTHHFFFGNINGSDSEDHDERSPRNPSSNSQQEHGQDQTHAGWQPAILPSVSEHPALRAQRSRPALAEEDHKHLQPEPLNPNLLNSQELSLNANDHSFQSTLSPSGENLGSLISHLRSPSNVSSIYPSDGPPFPDNEVPALPNGLPALQIVGSTPAPMPANLKSGPRVDSTYSASNPWDLEDSSNDYSRHQDDSKRGSISPMEHVQTGASFDPPAQAWTATQREDLTRSQVSQESDQPSWQTELRKQHHREASTATQQERAAFDNELAARRAAIQDNIKSIVDTDRCNSPTTGPAGAFKAFGMLRSKSSRDSMDVRRDVPAKAMKMLGMTPSAAASPSNGTPLAAQYERGEYSFDMARPRGDSGPKPPPIPTNASNSRAPHGEQDFVRRDWSDARARGDSQSKPPTGRSPASSTASRDARGRSDSAATTSRSRSRTGPYRDDLEKAMVEGTGSSAAAHADMPPLISRELTPRPSPDILQTSFDAAGRARSGSRPGATSGYFDAQSYHPLQTSAGARAPGGVVSPQTLSPTVYTPAGLSARSSPVVSPYVQNATPPLSGASTPLNSSFSNAPVTGGSRPLRKKTISKSEISEPTLVFSSTASSLDTVALPPGASLKNGMSEPPPVPPLNPRRRTTRKMFGGLGRADSAEDARQLERTRSKTPEPWTSKDPWTSKAQAPRDFSSSDAASAQSPAPAPEPEPNAGHHVLTPSLGSYDSSPALGQYGFQAAAVGPPERMERSATAGASVNGAMF